MAWKRRRSLSEAATASRRCLGRDSRVLPTHPADGYSMESQTAQGALGAFGPIKKVASLRAQGAFGPLKKVASLRDPCPESPKMVVFASQQNKTKQNKIKRNKTKQNTADSVVRSGNDSVSIRAVFCFVLFCFV